MVDRFDAPDNTSDDASTYKANIDNATTLNNLVAGDYFCSGQDTPDMTVRVEAGTRFIGGVLSQDAAQNSGTITAPSSNPRIDRVGLDPEDGSIVVITGSEAASPTAPDYTAGLLPIAQISLATSTTTITNSLITDERTFIAPPQRVMFKAKDTTGATSVTGDGTIYTIPLSTEEYDYGSNFDTGTYKFTIPITGVYRFSMFVPINDYSTANHSEANIYLTVDGSTNVLLTRYSDPVNDRLAITETYVGSFTSGEEITLRVRVNGSSLTADVDSGSWLAGELIS